MEDRRQKGARGEELALRYLQRKGFRLLERNLRVGRDELDLVMRDGAYIVFVEVKARTSAAFGLPREAVDFRKRQHMARAAAAYLQALGEDAPARFDVAEVDLVNGEVRHIADAFMTGA